MRSASHIKRLAAEVGFDLCGVIPARPLADQAPHLRRWLDEGHHGTLSYMERHFDLRLNPALLAENPRSIIVCALAYPRVAYPASTTDKIASFACIPDYHTTVKEKLNRMHAQLDTPGRAFVDSAPLLEKQLAIEAGLGWRGRQSLLVTPEFGPWVLLGELAIADQVDIYDGAVSSRCGSCRACVDACPTASIHDQYIDVRRCISYRTQQHLDGELHGWKHGCDICLDACPWGK